MAKFPIWVSSAFWTPSFRALALSCLTVRGGCSPRARRRFRRSYREFLIGSGQLQCTPRSQAFEAPKGHAARGAWRPWFSVAGCWAASSQSAGIGCVRSPQGRRPIVAFRSEAVILSELGLILYSVHDVIPCIDLPPWAPRRPSVAGRAS